MPRSRKDDRKDVAKVVGRWRSSQTDVEISGLVCFSMRKWFATYADAHRRRYEAESGAYIKERAARRHMKLPESGLGTICMYIHVHVVAGQ